ncbi:cytidylate kinase family protein [Geodermatophilus sp. DSM 44513]|uniref:cytidylate kinase family protein n=1 Tax=Geodermatophilus sp. DSM 44513 TaxID=1528104 RepID=UPI001412E625|nr:cytidylate kinase family protein [Geodermatophilus sp. DSM 44513]WNV76714.1 cytidylate kinase family protein [Geodermatophilus sp. DSM 44513]
MNIAFAGLTAAGKTTHAKVLAEQLNYEYVSATEIIADILGLTQAAAPRLWFTKLGEINAMREASDSLDEELESRLIQKARSSDHLVLDTWAMPWISESPAVNVWIESSFVTRTWKCYVSQGCSPALDMLECSALVADKDETTRQIFMRRHGFDLFTDKGPFQVIVDNTTLLSAPTHEACQRGIAAFAPQVLDAVTTALKRPSRLHPRPTTTEEDLLGGSVA